MSLGSFKCAMGDELMMRLRHVRMVGGLLTLTGFVSFDHPFVMTCGLLVDAGRQYDGVLRVILASEHFLFLRVITLLKGILILVTTLIQTSTRPRRN